MKRNSLTILLFPVLFACGETTTDPDPNPPDDTPSYLASLAIEPASFALVQQRTYQPSVSLRDQRNAPMTGVTVSWTSSDPAIVTVDADGLVTAEGLGSAMIVASASGFVDTAEVVVQVGWTSVGTSFWWQHSCGLSVDGTAYCWGANDYAQLGDSTYDNSPLPTAVQDVGVTYTSIAVGSIHSCGLTDIGQVYCWGANNFGQIGDGTNDTRTTPVLVSGALVFSDITAGSWYTCGHAGGALYCWGGNDGNQLGVAGGASDSQEPDPVQVHPSYTFSNIAAGGLHTCGVQAGTAYCWGWNEHSQLGDGTTNWGTHLPVEVQAQTTFNVVAATHLHSCGLDAASVVYCWGDYIGNGGTRLPQVFAQTDLLTLDAGHYHLCGINAANEAYCWGLNGVGQLGDGTTTASTVPVQVSSPVLWSQISAGSDHTCGVGVDGHMYCWGSNNMGQLGTGSSGAEIITPSRVSEPQQQ